MTPPKIAQLRELLEKATPDLRVDYEARSDGKVAVVSHAMHCMVALFKKREDAEAYVATCNALPALLTTLESSQHRVGELERRFCKPKIVDIQDTVYNDPYKRTNIIAISIEDLAP